MLRAGAGLGEVGQVLRHASVLTTAIYARSTARGCERWRCRGPGARHERLRHALDNYLAIRRALGYKLARTGLLLADFVAHLDANGTDMITIDAAVAWATFPPNGASDWWAQRRPALPAKADTVYECPHCEIRYLGEQRCDDCNTWCRRLGPGGTCPHCDDNIIAVSDLIAGNQYGVNPLPSP